MQYTFKSAYQPTLHYEMHYMLLLVHLMIRY